MNKAGLHYFLSAKIPGAFQEIWKKNPGVLYRNFRDISLINKRILKCFQRFSKNFPGVLSKIGFSNKSGFPEVHPISMSFHE